MTLASSFKITTATCVPFWLVPIFSVIKFLFWTLRVKDPINKWIKTLINWYGLFLYHIRYKTKETSFFISFEKTISTQHVLRHINFQFPWPGWHHPRPYDNLCPDPSDWGKTPSSYFTRTASESNIWKVAVSIMKMKTKLFFWSALSSNFFVFPFHFIDRKSRPFFAQSAGDQNAWSKCFWRSEWWEKLRDPGDTLKKRLKKMKTRRRGGERWGSNQHWAVLHGNLFGFSCDTVTNGLQLEERCLQNQGETLPCRAVYFSMILWVCFWWSDTI